MKNYKILISDSTVPFFDVYIPVQTKNKNSRNCPEIAKVSFFREKVIFLKTFWEFSRFWEKISKIGQSMCQYFPSDLGKYDAKTGSEREIKSLYEKKLFWGEIRPI